MPYVEGFGTGRSARSGCGRRSPPATCRCSTCSDGAPITLSLTPVLCDQLEQPAAIERCLRFLEEVRPETHRRDVAALRAEGRPDLAAELERSAAEYARAAERLRELGPGGLLAALGAHATWTSAATHAVLPLLATDAGVALQVQTGIASHRRRFGAWDGRLLAARVRPRAVARPAARGGRGARGVRRADRAASGSATRATCARWPPTTARCCGRSTAQTMALVWSERRLSRAAAPTATTTRHTTYHHRVWRNDGAPYDHGAALAQARERRRATSWPACASASPTGACACARWTPSCSATGGTRASTGWRR